MSGDRSGTIIACVVVMNCLSAFVVSLRFYVRAKLLRSVKNEDWCILVSMLFCVIFGVFMILECQNGLGRHLADVSKEEYSAYRKWSWIGTLCYNLSLCFTKLSILLLYLRVLTHDYIRKTTWAVMAIVAVYNAWGIGMYLTMCVPIAKVWKAELEGYCHPTAVWWALTYLHIATDFLIFIIPTPVLVTMTVPLRRKIGLLIVFTFGLFVCLISVIRSIVLNKLFSLPDRTWELVAIANWSTAEPNAAIVCGCLPTLRPVLAKVFGPLADRLFPDQQHRQSLGDPEAKGAALPTEPDLSWTDEPVVRLTRVETNNKNSKPQTTNTDSDAELTISATDHALGNFGQDVSFHIQSAITERCEGDCEEFVEMGFLAVALVSCAALASAASIPHTHAKRHISQLREDYDFVIVGSGTSGLTVADRLTEAFPAKNVLVIEYGDVHYAPGTFDPPTDWITPHPDAPPSWTFTSLPNPDMANATASVLAGQVVGGSSAVNGMFFDRASRHDYDAWAAAGGPEFEQSSHKWDWDGLFAFFQKSVTFTEPSADTVQKYHYTWDRSAYGNGSTPIYSSYPVFQWADQPLLSQAWQEMGINPATECAGGDKVGICWVPTSQHPVTARRSHAGLGHYADVLPRANYDLLVRHQVVRVVFPNGPSHGPPLVEARSLADDGRLFNVTVKGEVILSAGALHTPTVLQRSGIGPASFLRDVGIPVTLDLPGVGANLQDHCGPPVTWDYTEPYSAGFFPLPSEMVNNATFKADAIAGFDETPAGGPYTLAGGNSAIFVSLPRLAADYGAITGKIRAMVADGTAASHLPADLRSIPAMVVGYEAQLLVLADLLDNPQAPSLETPWATSEAPQASSALAFLLHPLSRGRALLNASDPLADEALGEYVRARSTLSFMHPCCTAAMLPEDRGGVVGPDLRVHGAAGLRVADMSVMPLLPGAHLSATAYAVGEKAADIIIQEWRGKEQ
ncbi:hypothetical protein VTH06DRAFT_4031 [Thermothelomyces fergusii]